MVQKSEKQQLWIILLIVLIGFLGSSVAYPLFPPLFLNPTDNTIVSPEWGDQARSIFLGIALAAYPLGQFFGSPVLGGLSDRYGRKQLLILSLIGSTIGYFLSGLALQYNWLWTLLISRFLTGFMEGNFSIVRAMAADLDGISKYKSFGRINAVSAIGYIMGPLIGGFLSDNNIVPWFSYGFPLLVAACFSGVAVFLSWYKLHEKPSTATSPDVTIMERFNLVKRFRTLFQSNDRLKYLLLMSTIFTFSVDIFYEFGPVYLTGLGTMTPAGIAVYNAALSLALAIGAGWLPHKLALHFSSDNIIEGAMLITGIIFFLMVFFPFPIFIFLLFAAVGLTIAIVNTNSTIQISSVANKTIQGEALGAQLGLRMLGDAAICLAGGFLIISSVMLPIVASGIIAFMAVGIHVTKLRNEVSQWHGQE